MKFFAVSEERRHSTADALVIPFFYQKKHPKEACRFSEWLKICKVPLRTSDFLGKEGEVLFYYPDWKEEKRVLFLGLGEEKKLSIEKLRRSYSKVIKASFAKKIRALNILLPSVEALTEEEIVQGISEGLLLTNYTYEALKSFPKKEDKTVLVEKVTLIGASKKGLAHAVKMATIAEGVCFARDLVNANADDTTPQDLARMALDLATQFSSLHTTVLGKKQIIKEKMGLLLAVNRGSCHDPAFIVLRYQGARQSKEHTVLVGKGITYDTGGLNLKPTGHIETMKSDMSGAAAVFGTLLVAAKLKLKVNITGVIPATENSVGSRSYKPGDVYVSYVGKTVEIGNTDAEGRLILADALAYAVKRLKPTTIIDLATLTGAMTVSLGEEVTGFMASEDKLAEELLKAGERTFERLWRFPLYEEYKEQIKSDIADLKNTGGKGAGSITAALFLKEFVEDIPWAHLDIAGTAFLSKERSYTPKNASGVGVRLLIDYLSHV